MHRLITLNDIRSKLQISVVITLIYITVVALFQNVPSVSKMAKAIL